VPIGTEIRQLLSSVDTQMQTLSLLSEPLQYSSTKNTFRETVDVIVAESDKYFGSKEALRRYAVDEKLFGSEAIRAAQDHEETMGTRAKLEEMEMRAKLRKMEERARQEHEMEKRAKQEEMEMRARLERMNVAEPSTKPYLGRGRKTEREDTFLGDPSPHAPVYVNVKKEWISDETLKYYDLSWEVDSVSPQTPLRGTSPS
jgi:hypothetical protein